MVSRDRGHFFYAPPECSDGERIQLPRDEHHHLMKVLRARGGEEVFVSDGEGMVYQCSAEPDGTLLIHARLPDFGESKQRLTLAVGTLKGDANRDVVDTATQLGVAEIIFFQAARSEGRLTANRIDRLRRTVITAVKQCGRARQPVIRLESSLRTFLDSLQADEQILLAHPDQSESHPEIQLPANLHYVVMIGPEGGLDDSEIETVLLSGGISLTLADRRLRSEVAVAAALSFVLHLTGECRL